MNKKRAVLRVTGRSHDLVATVRAGKKGTGRVLARTPVTGTVWSDPLFRLAEQVARKHDAMVLVETFSFFGGYDNCVVTTREDGSIVHISTKNF
jgi:hypothetical protein